MTLLLRCAAWERGTCTAHALLSECCPHVRLRVRECMCARARVSTVPPRLLAFFSIRWASASKPRIAESVTFEALLRSGGIVPDHNILMRAMHRYGDLVNSARAERSMEAAISAYNMASALPSTATAAAFRVDGLVVNGDLWQNSEFTICYRGTLQFVLKPLTSRETKRAEAFMAQIDGPISHVTTFELVESIHGKTFMLMPRFLDTLERCPILYGDGVIKLWRQMSAALEAVHAIGFAHMDVKPANICMNEAGDFVIVDLGSIARFEQRTSCTACYIPTDLLPASVESFNIPASPLVDWWMLAMTLAEKGCGDSPFHIGGAKGWRMAEVRARLAEYLPVEVWSELQVKLE